MAQPPRRKIVRKMAGKLFYDARRLKRAASGQPKRESSSQTNRIVGLLSAGAASSVINGSIQRVSQGRACAFLRTYKTSDAAAFGYCLRRSDSDSSVNMNEFCKSGIGVRRSFSTASGK